VIFFTGFSDIQGFFQKDPGPVELTVEQWHYGKNLATAHIIFEGIWNQIVILQTILLHRSATASDPLIGSASKGSLIVEPSQ